MQTMLIQSYTVYSLNTLNLPHFGNRRLANYNTFSIGKLAFSNHKLQSWMNSMILANTLTTCMCCQ